MKQGFAVQVMLLCIGLAVEMARGDQWTPLVNGPPIGIASHLAIAPSNPQVMYVGTMNGRLFRSEDGGNEWTGGHQIGRRVRLEGRPVAAIVVDPTDHDVLYAGFSNYSPTALKSANGGRTWVELDVRNLVVAIDPLHPDTLYISSARSRDGGRTWKDVRGPRGRRSGFIHPETGVIFVESFQSQDGGETWIELFPDREVYRFATDPINPQNVYAATRGGIEVSRDGGRTWLGSLPGLQRALIYDVGVAPEAPENLYMIRSLTPADTLFWSPDAGSTWESISASLSGHSVTDEEPVQLFVLAKGHLLIRTELTHENYRSDRPHGHVYETTDNGATWRQLGAETLVRSEMTDFGYGLSSENDLVYYAVNGTGLFRREEDGDGWHRVFTGWIPALTVDPLNADEVYIYFEFERRNKVLQLRRSRDGGKTWTHTGLEDRLVARPVVKAGDAENVYAPTVNEFLRTRDGGMTWTGGKGGLRSFTVSPHDFEYVLIEGEDHWYSSRDGGATWLEVGPELDRLVAAWSPRNPDIGYVGRIVGGNDFPSTKLTFYRTEDGGHTWESFTTIAAAAWLDFGHLIVHPNDDEVLISAGESDILISLDGGLTWGGLAAQPLDEPVVTVLTDPRSERRVLAVAQSAMYEFIFAENPTSVEPAAPVVSFDTLTAQGTWEYLFEGPVTSLAHDPAGGVWFKTMSSGAHRVGKISDGSVELTEVDPDLASLAKNLITVDPDGGVWTGTLRFDGEKWEDRTPVNYAEVGLYNTRDQFTVMLVRANGEIWARTPWSDSREAFLFEDARAVHPFERFDVEYLEHVANAQRINVIVEHPEGSLWIGSGGTLSHNVTDLGGIAIFDGVTWRSLDLGDGLSHPFVRDIAFGPNGDAWVATDGGVTHFGEGRGIAYTTANSALINDSAKTVAVDLSGAVWIGTPTGASRFDGEHWTTYREEHGLLGHSVLDVLVDAKGRIWFATSDGVRVLTYDVVTAVEETGPLPHALALKQNSPNPFNAQTRISFTLPEASTAAINIYNIQGQRLRTWELGKMRSGAHQLIWDGRDKAGRFVGTGIYFYALTSDVESTLTRKLMLLR